MAKFLSVIIATFRRPKKLKACLASLEDQTLNQNFFEIVVVEDNKRQGPATTRNRGIRKSRGDILLFLNDDVVCDKNLMKEHFFFHKLRPQEKIACVGNINWANSVKKNQFLEWLDRSGFQFSFEKLKNRQTVDFRHFYSANLSIKKSFLLKHGLFDEQFPYPTLEDTELGYRLSKKGLKIVFNKQAVAYHNHQPIFGEFLDRARKVGFSARILVKKHPELVNKIVPTHLSWEEKLRMFFWQMVSIPGRPLKSRKIVFESYRRQILRAIQKAYFLKPSSSK